jgi:hypothetical protein
MSFASAAPHCTGDLGLALSRARHSYVQGGLERQFEVAVCASKLWQKEGGRAKNTTGSELEPYLYRQQSLKDILAMLTLQDAQKQELAEALSERGLEVQNYSCACNKYIRIGAGNVDEIVDDLDEMQFYREHTTYWTKTLYSSSQVAKIHALTKWIAQERSSNDSRLSITLQCKLGRTPT